MLKNTVNKSLTSFVLNCLQQYIILKNKKLNFEKALENIKDRQITDLKTEMNLVLINILKGTKKENHKRS